MKPGFNQSQFDQDVEATKSLLVGFLKSFGPKQKKMGEQPVGILEEQHIRFRLSLVEMGIAQIIRICLVIIVGILLYALVFRNSDGWFKVITALVFIGFLSWMLLDHLKEGAKDGSRIAAGLIAFNTQRESVQDGLMGRFMGIIDGFFNAIDSVVTGIFKKKSGA